MKPKKLSAETRAVIDAVREALDVPAAAPHPGDRERRGEILDARIRVLLSCLTDLLDAGERREGGRVDVQAHMDAMRKWIAAYTVSGYSRADDSGGEMHREGDRMRACRPDGARPAAGRCGRSGARTGGYVCGAPDEGPDGICGMPVESEPCPYHGRPDTSVTGGAANPSGGVS
ncbi:hypothetical protein Acsp04_58820 [Actinomadura sp. NBRC 104425]|uniref:hypothetical protein n=1 Tax=Actinomadura sp. NBRC 104425 TaxID=3032204 RepID=UPI0024A2DDEA|nr:hypothetical protein [Actinomadura sp. NBRC 104425]GLZ15647.1 hypothetical protein Acsp04_58820 [Actinomadura sp. NBRC 104425]